MASAALARDADDALANDGVLPADLLYEVLLRVPAKALCRFRLVCRSWRSLTSNPRFARAHSARHPQFVALDHGESEIHIVDMYSGTIVKRVHGIGHLYTHLSMQDDLVCVSRMASAGVEQVLINPATSAIKILPHGNRPNPVDTCILGHVPSTGEYKVLSLSYYITPEGIFRVACEVIALGGDNQRWRAKPSPADISILSWRVAVVHGVAYFRSFKSSDDDDSLA